MGRTTDDYVEEATIFIDSHNLDLDSNIIAYEYLIEGFVDTMTLEEFIEKHGDDYKTDQNNKESDEEFAFDGFIEPEEYNKTRTYGATFTGVLSLKEYEDEYIYIPPSSHCYLRCIEKIFNIKINYEDFKNNETITKIRNKLKKDYNLVELPNVHKFSKGKWIRVNNDYKVNDLPKLFEFRVRKNIFHVGIIKEMKTDLVKHIKSSLEFTKDTKLDNKFQTKLTSINVKPFKNTIFTYDIETYTDEFKHLHPIGIGYQKIDFNFDNLIFEEYTDLSIKQDLLNKAYNFDPKIFTGPDCLMDFIKDLSTNFEGESIEFYAHYGGKFDAIFFKQLKEVKFISQIKNSGCLLSLKIKYNNTTIEFKDSYKYVTCSLNKFCDSMKIKGKDEFDIKGKNKNFFEDTTDWLNYLKQDIICLSYALLYFEHYLRTFGLSITIAYGLPGLSWQTLYFNCFRLRADTFITNHNVTKQFILNSIYGGRVIPFKKKNLDKLLVCLDANSLYPSAMKIGEYPIGEYFIMKKDIDYYLNNNNLFIAEVELDGLGRKYPLIPNKKTSRKDFLIYPSNKFRGVYTSVEIQDALAMGYKIDKFHKGIYWIRKDRIFFNYIEYVYNLRKESKDDVIKDLLKLLMNSAYGKFLETIESTDVFVDRDNEKHKNCKSFLIGNNQKEVHITYDEELVRKPIHIASFILSYARRIMNDYMIKIGLENIFYTDTDSIYTDIISAKNIQTSNDLGGMKNDYGENMFIEKAIFLDVKRYWLKFNTNNLMKTVEKVKFNGFNFREGSLCADYLYKEKGDTFEYLFEQLSDVNNYYNIFNEKLIRKNNTIVVNAKEMLLHVDWTKRFKLIDNNFFPIDYIPELDINIDITFRSYNYKLSDNFKKGKHKIHYDFYVWSKNDVIIDQLNYVTNFISKNISNQKIYYILHDTKYYEFKHLNPIHPAREIDEEYHKSLIHSKNNNPYGFRINITSLNSIMSSVLQTESNFSHQQI